MVAAMNQRLAESVTAGKLTQAKADELAASATTRIADVVNGVVQPGRGFGARPRPSPRGSSSHDHHELTTDPMRFPLKGAARARQTALSVGAHPLPGADRRSVSVWRRPISRQRFAEVGRGRARLGCCASTLEVPPMIGGNPGA
jgi:hypothetical protein